MFHQEVHQALHDKTVQSFDRAPKASGAHAQKLEAAAHVPMHLQ